MLDPRIRSFPRHLISHSTHHGGIHRLVYYLLPFNCAFGANGGDDYSSSPMSLGVERYMVEKKRNGHWCTSIFATCSMLSHMRNCGKSFHQNFRQVTSSEFPELVAFVDCLYQDRDQMVHGNSSLISLSCSSSLSRWSYQSSHQYSSIRPTNTL